MGFQFSADEIFEMAGEIERNGAKFYRKAAGGTGDSKVKQSLLDLAAMEDEHEQTFASMRAEVSGREQESTAFDPQGEAALYLQAFADGHVFDVKADPSENLTGGEGLDKILRTAIGLEKDSIVFYLGMKDLVTKKHGKDKMDAIIREEKNHITTLSKQLASL